MRKARINTLARQIIPPPEPGPLYFSQHGQFRALSEPYTDLDRATVEQMVGPLIEFRWSDGKHMPGDMTIEEFAQMLGLVGIVIDLGEVVFWRGIEDNKGINSHGGKRYGKTKRHTDRTQKSGGNAEGDSEPQGDRITIFDTRPGKPQARNGGTE